MGISFDNSLIESILSPSIKLSFKEYRNQFFTLKSLCIKKSSCKLIKIKSPQFD